MTTYPTASGTVSGALLVLAHGAGAGEGHPFMVAIARGLAERGIDVVTFDFPYIQQKRKVPDKAPVLEAAFRDAISTARHGVGRDRALFIGGKSMGGRMATHLAAQGLDDLRGVVVLGYPLHPPGKRDQLRTAHFPKIRVPLLIVQGERDTFGTPAELEPIVGGMSAEITLHVIPGGDHSFAVPRSVERTTNSIYAGIMDTMSRWIQLRA
jgi:predicted alpha/beta-hydrolase family hydrolase